ncbi:hypothetical protein NQP46_21230 [Streptomyces albus]|nr:hypothetical protein NQP46_21230 [Streptomyces albus]
MYDRTLAAPREERGQAAPPVNIACCMRCHRLTRTPVPPPHHPQYLRPRHHPLHLPRVRTPT